MPRSAAARKRKPSLNNKLTWRRSRALFRRRLRPVLEIEPLAHFLAGLEIGDSLGGDVDRVAGARVAALAGVAVAGREGAEAAQLDPAAMLELADDRIEEGRNHPLDLLAGEIGMVVAKLLDQLGTDHGFPLSKDERACAQGDGGPPSATVDPG